MLLKNKTAVVTGCNRGIGLSILKLFAENGANVFACVRCKTDKFTEICTKISQKHRGKINPVYFDLSDSEQIKIAIKNIVDFKQSIDILVNNAGIGAGSFFQMTPVKKLKEVFDINFFSQILFTQGISRYMMRQNKGSIINITSTAGLIGDAGMISYGSSKASLIFATKTMATELGTNNIRVNAIAPSITKTDMYDQMDEKARDKLIKSAALNRPAEPEEIANVALFLASDLSSYITGQVLRVDGGII